MKKNYRRVERVRRGQRVVRYENIFRNYHRRIRTSGEIRANENDAGDPELSHYGVKVRACRTSTYLDSRNDFPVGREYKKSWKDFTKNKKQWEPKSDMIHQPEYSRILAMIEQLTGVV